MRDSVRRIRAVIATVLLIVLVSATFAGAEPSPPPPTATTLSWADLSKMPLPPAAVRIPYGRAPQQFGELRVPAGEGPFPVMVLIHGGCYQNAFDYVYITRLAAWLTEHGVATWTIEYRRLGDDGGGWPGTFQDVAAATDSLRQIATASRIDLERVYAAGHSAGGQLALWLATRQKLAESSALFTKDPLPIHGVLGLAAITDLAQYRHGAPRSCHSSVEPLLGGTPEEVAIRYAETSPKERLPIGVPQVFIHGEKDPIVSTESVQAYADAAKNAGDKVVVLPLRSLGHFEASVPLPSTEAAFQQALSFLLER